MMSKHRSSSTGREKGSMVKLRLIMSKLTRGFSLGRRPDFDDDKYDEQVGGATTYVPKDVKEGQFVLFAVHGGMQKRFIVELEWLSNPEFLRLLEKAEEEFGFEQAGALAVPCRPEDLERILGQKGNCGGDGNDSGTSMIESC